MNERHRAWLLELAFLAPDPPLGRSVTSSARLSEVADSKTNPIALFQS